MIKLNLDIVEKFVIAAGSLMPFKAPVPFDDRRVTVMFTYAPPGWVTEEDLSGLTAEQDIDLIHLEFEPDREFEGPVNIALCEDRNGTILTWPECHLWADRDQRLVLLVPKDQDFGFSFDGVALIRVTDLETGPDRDRGIADARKLLMSAAWRVPNDIPRNTREFRRRSARAQGVN
jgi:hypothetical protein